MADQPKLPDAVQQALQLGFPPTTLSLRPAQAAGHRLARPVNVRGATPDRSFAVVHGLAVHSADVIGTPVKEDTTDQPETDTATFKGTELTRHVALSAADEAGGDGQNGARAEAGTATLKLRSQPATGRREDSLDRGEAVAVTVGATVPRGADMVYPFDLLEQAAATAPGATPAEPADEPEQPGDEQKADEENASLPVAAPPRDWLLAERYREGQVEVPRLPQRLENTLVNYGGWSRSRDPVIAERTVLRAGELALLEALGVDEVVVYRRPVIGVACLEEPRADIRDGADNGEPEPNPLQVLAAQLIRSSRVAALPLGRPSLKFRPLAKQVRRWLEQVDILLLAGGSSAGHRCLGHDILSSMGEVTFAGIDLEPGANTSLGTVGGKPVVAIPGSFADVLAAYVLLVRPLAHRYLTPNQYSGTVELELEHGSRLAVERDTAVPVRFGTSQDGRALSTRFSGRVRDPWQDYARGQALVVLEAGRQYADGEIVSAHLY